MPVFYRSVLLFSLFAVVMFCAIALPGCGNNFSAPTGFVTRAVTFTIKWGPTDVTDMSGAGSTAIPAPANAKSAVLILKNAQPNNMDLNFTAKRPLNSNAPVEQPYPVPTPVKVGPTILIAEFYLQADPKPSTDGGKTGDVPIGTLMAAQNIENKPANQPNMITIDTIVPPDKVVVAPGQTVAVKGTLQLMYTAFAKDGSVLPIGTGTVSTGSNSPPVKMVIINPVSQADRLLIDGDKLLITGFASGTPTVSVTVNTPSLDSPPYVSKTSDPQVVTVTSLVHIVVTPTTSTLNVQTDSATFTAQVSHVDNSALRDNTVIWSVQEQNGGTIITNPADSSTVTYKVPGQTGTFHLVARSLEDPSQTATATITVIGGSSDVIIH